jgi:hypothetical protein
VTYWKISSESEASVAVAMATKAASTTSVFIAVTTRSQQPKHCLFGLTCAFEPNNDNNACILSTMSSNRYHRVSARLMDESSCLTVIITVERRTIKRKCSIGIQYLFVSEGVRHGHRLLTGRGTVRPPCPSLARPHCIAFLLQN